MCEFQSLYYGDDGYVVKCKRCNHYQFAYLSTMLTLTGEDFRSLCRVAKNKCCEHDCSFAPHAKSIIIPAAAQGLYMLLTNKEATRLCEILDEADNEEKALSMISLFNQ